MTTSLKNYAKQFSVSSVPLFLMIDQEGGRVTRLKNGFTQFPSNMDVAMGGDPEVAYTNAYITGMELQAVGINMNLAPVVDVNVNPENPVIGNRAFSNCPKEVVKYASKSLSGYKKANVIAVLKHFPGHGDVEKDSHESLPVVNKSIVELTETELYPFSQLSDRAPVIMTAHLLVPALDKHCCATVSKIIIEGVLRNQMRYQGVIMTDSLAMQGVLDHCLQIEEAAVRSIEAGHDILLLGGNALLTTERPELKIEDVRKIVETITHTVQSGRISEDRIDCSIKRILRLKQDYCL